MNNDQIFESADSLYEKGLFNEAFALFLKGAENGDSSCMTRVALMYADGEGVKKDIDKSIHWDVKACEIGNESGALNAAITYKGIGDFKNAEIYFIKALELKNGESAFELAKMYMDLAKKYFLVSTEHENVSDETKEEAKAFLKKINE